MSDFEVGAFLRSINLRFDIEHPERVAHFQPTSKSTQIVRSICGLEPERVFIASAAYGSGKTLTATFSALAVEGRRDAHKMLKAVGERFDPFDANTGAFVRGRTEAGSGRGLVISLEGYVPSYRDGLVTAATESSRRLGFRAPRKAMSRTTAPVEALGVIVDWAKHQGVDRVALIWDEFGRHLEGLANNARADELSALQCIAEFVMRQRHIPVTLTLVLHQSFFHYAGYLNQTARNEWRKIEGRFRSIEYLDDSREMYRLIGQVIAVQHVSTPNASISFHHMAAELMALGLFSAFKDQESLAEVLRNTYPFDPAVIYMLPRLSARVAQNERTLFEFLRAMVARSPVTLSDLYDFFAPAMRVDVTVGGTYRQWLEVESAITKAQSPVEEHLLKSACLLALGLSGQRFRVGLQALVAAAAGYDAKLRQASDTAVKQLTQRKLLLHRRHNDEVSVWHGTDADLRGRLDEEMLKASASFDLLNFLGREVPAPIWRPLEYNSRYFIRRYFISVYVEAATLLLAGAEHPVWTLGPNEDGKVIYVLPQHAGEIEPLRALAETMQDKPGVVVVVPRNPLKMLDAALEVWSLMRLQADQELLGSDPLVLPELRQMTDEARTRLVRMMERLLNPRPDGPEWFSGGRQLPAYSQGELRRQLSQATQARFSLTPRINSEALVRRHLTRPMVNARKKLVLGILERTGEKDLRFSRTTPDASMYRTVVRNTGLYRETESGTWGWAVPEELPDMGLRGVWQIIREFFTEASPQSKSPAELLKRLQDPPYGVRAGLFPVLIAAGLKAYPAALAIMRDGVYLPDILPSDIEALCNDPERYAVSVLPLDTNRRSYLLGMAHLFGEATDKAHCNADLVRCCYDALEAWKRTLPSSVLTTRHLEEDTFVFRDLIRQISDPARLFFEDIPTLARIGEENPDALLATVSEWRDRMSEVKASYRNSAETSVRTVLGRGESGTLLELAGRWASRIPQLVVHKLAHQAKAVVRIIRQASSGDYNPEYLIDALAIVLVEKPTTWWDDTTPARFAERLRSTIKRIEDAVIDNSEGREAVPLVEERIASVYTRLVELVGPDEAQQFIKKLHTTTVHHHGLSARSTRS